MNRPDDRDRPVAVIQLLNEAFRNDLRDCEYSALGMGLIASYISALEAELDAAPREMAAKDVPMDWQWWHSSVGWYNRQGNVWSVEPETVIARPKPEPDVAAELARLVHLGMTPNEEFVIGETDWADTARVILERFDVTPKAES